jgi:hypothetical protein
VLLLAHGALVVVLSVLLLVLAAQPTEDANIGAGIALLAVQALGLPWTLLLLLAPAGWPTGALVGCAIAAASLNVVLHGLLRARRLGSRANPARTGVRDR